MNNVRDFGAKGDGVANDTAAIQRAIDAGGTVYIPGGVYVTGTLYLRSNGGLELAQDATLLASRNPADYNSRDFYEQDVRNDCCGGSRQHLVVANELQNVFIRGGRFDGNARNILEDHTIVHTFMGGPLWNCKGWRPAQLITFYECSNVRLSDFTIEDATGWSCFLYGCENVTIHGINIRNSPYVGEDDGIDIDCCRKVVVSDCNISAGDDAFTLRACPTNLKNPKPCEWVTVSNCIFHSDYAHAIRVGVGSGEIRHCQFSGISAYDSHIAIHVNSKYSEKGEGVEIHDVAFRNFHVNVEQLAFIRLDYKFVKETPCPKSIYNIFIENVDGHVRQPSMIRGNGIGSIHDIHFTNIHLNVDGRIDIPENTRKFCMIEGTDGAFELNKVHNVSFTNLNLTYEHPECWKTDIAQHDATDVTRK